MKFALASILIAASFIAAAPASAYTGIEFSNECGAGMRGQFLNDPFCHAYLLGFYEALAASGEMCPRKRPTDARIAGVVRNWLRFRGNHPTNPMGYAIRNALTRAWGCR